MTISMGSFGRRVEIIVLRFSGFVCKHRFTPLNSSLSVLKRWWLKVTAGIIAHRESLSDMLQFTPLYDYDRVVELCAVTGNVSNYFGGKPDSTEQQKEGTYIAAAAPAASHRIACAYTTILSYVNIIVLPPSVWKKNVPLAPHHRVVSNYGEYRSSIVHSCPRCQCL